MFANQRPDEGKWTSDRLDLWEITEEDIQPEILRTVIPDSEDTWVMSEPAAAGRALHAWDPEDCVNCEMEEEGPAATFAPPPLNTTKYWRAGEPIVISDDDED